MSGHHKKVCRTQKASQDGFLFLLAHGLGVLAQCASYTTILAGPTRDGSQPVSRVMGPSLFWQEGGESEGLWPRIGLSERCGRRFGGSV
jgi:hypothetical protein